MENNMGMNFYNYNLEEDKQFIDEMFYNLIKLGNLTPIIGNGFTKNVRTKNGVIPTVYELMEEMIDILCNILKNSKEEYEGAELTDLADLFWIQLEKKENHKYLMRFQEYLEMNFTNSYDLEQPKRTFLNSNWAFIFTLNYDDTIENLLSINKYIPYESINISKKKQYLIKLHGDAKKFYMTGDKKFCILGNSQYANLIKDEKNKDVLNLLEDTFFSRDILFLGCRLNNELDILFSADSQLNEKLKIDKNHKVIYVLFDDGYDIKPFKLMKYGITDVISVDKNSIIDFYQMIHEKSVYCQSLHEEDVLKDYSDINFEILDDKNPENKKYLFFENRVNINNGIIKLPSFFVDRTMGKKIIKSIENDPFILHLISGSNLSGKTYLLIQLLRHFNFKKTYYFPSKRHLEDELLIKLLNSKDILILFDEDVISYNQYKNIILPSFEKMSKNNINIVLNINRSDSDFYRDDDCYSKFIKFYLLDNKFNKEEIQIFNKKIGKLRLVDYYINNTILDYLYRAEEGILKKNANSILPKVHFLSTEDEQKIRALIALTTKGSLTSMEAIELRIDESLYKLAIEFPTTIQKDYFSNLERKKNVQSGYKFILNSSYWAMKCLSNLASNYHNHETIAKAYHAIVDSYSYLDVKEFNKKAMSYYILDKIQQIFYDKNHKGVLKLPYLIYEELHFSLSDNYHFLHQEAKCELRFGRKESNNLKKQEILEKAFENLERALSLAEKVNSDNIEYTISHMKVTEALILTNYVFSGKLDMLGETIVRYNDVFVKYKDLIPQLKDYEIADFNQFFNAVLNNKYELNKADMKTFNTFYNNYTIIKK